ncbi:pathogenesis-related protein PRB1-3-like [Iris pallida]|uniref:Pathogenesis-related protein PRB1-3-like n=1 Tax=Iris pallida TaxID=29817 RepID=A0AAX6I655_IRIPA|nr:pathogenesis-related protein PRB1-3-like [Iris pallida]
MGSSSNLAAASGAFLLFVTTLTLIQLAYAQNSTTGLRERPQLCAQGRRCRARVVGCEAGGVREEVRASAGRGLQDGPLKGSLRGEPLQGLRQAVQRGVRGKAMGCREAVLRLQQQHLRFGQGLRPLHASGLGEIRRHRMRPCDLQQWIYLHNLQL